MSNLKQSKAARNTRVSSVPNGVVPTGSISEPPTLNLAMTRELLAEVGGDPLQFVLAITRRYGDVVRYETPCGSAYLFNHPDHIGRVFTHPNYRRAKSYPLKVMLGEGLLTTEGEQWRRPRRLMQPEFHQQRIAALGTLVAHSTEVMLQRWNACAEDGQAFDVALEMFQLMLEITLKGLFSDDLDLELPAIHDALAVLTEEIGNFINIQFAVPLQISGERNRQVKVARCAMDDAILRMIRKRRHKSGEYHDLLSLLMGDPADEGGLDEQQLRSEILTMIFAGSESVTRMLTWVWALLSEHDDADQRVYEEGRQVLNGRSPQVSDLAALPYTRMILDEALRLYPPVWALFRQAQGEDVVGGYRIEANAAVVISAFAVQRHPDYWDAPDAFVPERFAPDISVAPRNIYFPFGGGQHLCMGNHLALLEGQLVVAAIAQKYHLRVAEGHEVKPLAALTLRPQNGLRVQLAPRVLTRNPA